MEEIKENGIVAQEVSSTTQNAEVEVNKRSLRVETWKNIQKDSSRLVFNRIPFFNAIEKAVALLVSTDEFKNATKIKVFLERVLDGVNIEIIKSGKELYLPVFHGSNGLFTKVICPSDSDDATIINVLKTKSEEYRTVISVENKFKLDMIVIGSVLVSRDGHRIGRGNGFVDLDIGLLIHCGAITSETIIVTLVDDKQVVDTLPENLFQKYDAPVDIIVTPTTVIKVSKRLPRPAGLYWELLSERRLKIIIALQTVKEMEEKEGKIITLKSEDTDVESKPRMRPRMNRRRQYNRRPYKKSITETQPGNETENIVVPPRRSRYNRRPRESKSIETKKEQSAERKNRNFCVKVANITRDMRYKDLKEELVKRDCMPINITWKPQFGKCFLHYPKQIANEQDTNIDGILKSLGDLSLTVKKNGEETKTFNLNVKLLSDVRSNQEETKQESSSENEISKSSLRFETWKNVKKNKLQNFNHTFNHLPNTGDVEKAVALLLTTQEFKDSVKIMVWFERVLDGVKIDTIKAGKELHLPILNESSGLFTKVICPSDADEATIINILKTKSEEHITDISVENKYKLDMIVIGSVLVSRDGHRIGRGNGFVDLDIGLLIHCGVITPETIIVTIVDDKQVVDTMPENLFQKHDVPVDMIVTPTTVIKVEQRLPRPAGLYWELLTERILKNIKALQTIKDMEEKEGKFITLKPEETKKSVRNKSRRTNSTTDRDFCVEVTNISRGIGVKYLKDELRKRECIPTHISWKGYFGKCYLHYPRRNAKEQDTNIEEILKSLNDLSLEVKKNGDETPLTCKLNVELLTNTVTDKTTNDTN